VESCAWKNPHGVMRLWLQLWADNTSALFLATAYDGALLLAADRADQLPLLRCFA